MIYRLVEASEIVKHVLPILKKPPKGSEELGVVFGVADPEYYAGTAEIPNANIAFREALKDLRKNAMAMGADFLCYFKDKTVKHKRFLSDGYNTVRLQAYAYTYPKVPVK